eukprot:CAMPEP_0204858290 /NCGR_PEP_ID=MMETSP1347-20130617/22226_1 /ASSEMBLY_ACC=CAM_ASM_000690 /TAXON_ID=215587 /ORGANISM="Aplanochytrium stocchinoi, Strain GSBS06" /LENGTH=222 /DNA_ID=CAMNT_0052006259 /DNA_START=247 /DNA_END=915 /DNA_ORIENTATION=-
MERGEVAEVVRTLYENLSNRNIEAVESLQQVEALLLCELVFVLSIIGGLKSLGLLQHHLSQFVGILEFVGAFILLNPFLNIVELLELDLTYKLEKDQLKIFDFEISALIGCSLLLYALGIVLSTPGKFGSPVCWFHILVIFALVQFWNRSDHITGNYYAGNEKTDKIYYPNFAPAACVCVGIMFGFLTRLWYDRVDRNTSIDILLRRKEKLTAKEKERKKQE